MVGHKTVATNQWDHHWRCFQVGVTPTKHSVTGDKKEADKHPLWPKQPFDRPTNNRHKIYFLPTIRFISSMLRGSVLGNKEWPLNKKLVSI